MKPERIDLLCRVVDNYGDIGVVWRLARSLAALRPGQPIRIITDRREVFAELEPSVDPRLARQELGPFTILDWDSPEALFRAQPPEALIEAFACGLPPGYEAVLHDPAPGPACLHLVLEYLSAETWTAEYHLLPSLSRGPRVSKRFFLPGFLPGTGGLVWDPGFMALRERARTQASGLRSECLAAWGGALPAAAAGWAWVLVFSYEHDYGGFLDALADWAERRGAPVLLWVAAGRSAAALSSALARRGSRDALQVRELPFLPQTAWDQLLVAMDLAVVRGEESLSRAALAGIPFVWHAYLQDEGYQGVKVEALLEAAAPSFADRAAFEAWRRLMRDFNRRQSDSAHEGRGEDWRPLLEGLAGLSPGFRAWAEKLEKIGDCAAKLLSLIDDFG